MRQIVGIIIFTSQLFGFCHIIQSRITVIGYVFIGNCLQQRHALVNFGRATEFSFQKTDIMLALIHIFLRLFNFRINFCIEFVEFLRSLEIIGTAGDDYSSKNNHHRL